MILISKLTFSVIQIKLSLRSFKIKKIIFEQNESSSNKLKKTTKSKTKENQLKGSEANLVDIFTKLIMKGTEKKVTIIPKGFIPKFKGPICNVNVKKKWRIEC